MASVRSTSISVVFIFPASRTSSKPCFWAVKYQGVSFRWVKLISSLAVQYLNRSATFSSSSISLSLNSLSENEDMGTTSVLPSWFSTRIKLASRLGSSVSSMYKSGETGPSFHNSNFNPKKGIPVFRMESSSSIKISLRIWVLETGEPSCSYWHRKMMAFPNLSI